jgi:hypothetical protein
MSEVLAKVIKIPELDPAYRPARPPPMLLTCAAAVKFGLSGLVPLAEGLGDLSHEGW